MTYYCCLCFNILNIDFVSSGILLFECIILDCYSPSQFLFPLFRGDARDHLFSRCLVR